MPVMVRFDTVNGPWAVGIEHALEVRPVGALRPLPSPRADVAGVIDRDGQLVPVVHSLGEDGRHVLVVRSGTTTIGVLVSEVTGVVRVDDDAVGPAPVGQDDPLVGATMRDGAVLAFLIDVEELARSIGELP